jgi:hypothetical protein
MGPIQIISGGQTGVDQIALECARLAGLPTGGVAPRNYLTEAGLAPWLADFGLTQSHSRDYADRTRRNIQAADATILFGDCESPGSKCALREAGRTRKDILCNPSACELVAYVVRHDVRILNVAGNRASKLDAEAEQRIRATLVDAFRQLIELADL